MKSIWLLFLLLVSITPYLSSQELDRTAHKHPVLRKVAVSVTKENIWNLFKHGAIVLCC